MLFSFFQEIGVGEDERQVLLDKNPAVVSTSLDSLRAWVCSFRFVGTDDLVLSQLITKSPSLLIAEEIGPFLQFDLDDLEGKIEPLQLKRQIASSPRSSVDKIFDVLNKVNLYKALCLKSLEEIERTIALFVRFGGIDLIVMHSTLLNFDLETQLVPRIAFLAELNGGDDEATGTLLGKLPAILKLEDLGSYLGVSFSLIDLSHDNENNLAVVKNGEILISNGNGNFGADGHECNENFDGANSSVVIPHILFRDEITDIEVKQMETTWEKPTDEMSPTDEISHLEDLLTRD
ncbi:unnamed protein product [Malus baccata var. baccata]